MHPTLAVIAIVAALALPGCASVALTAGGIAGSAGVNHTLNGIAYKTFTAPVEKVRVATMKSLSRMQIKVSRAKKVDRNWEIDATAIERTINIELEAVSRSATRMRVVTNKGGFIFKDAATSTEIIIQTARRLAGETTAKR